MVKADVLIDIGIEDMSDHSENAHLTRLLSTWAKARENELKEYMALFEFDLTVHSQAADYGR